MSIRLVSGRGVSRAEVTCRGCGRAETVPCDARMGCGGTRAADRGQVQRKMTARGWAVVKGQLRCPGCEARRRAGIYELETDMTRKTDAVIAPRQPDREQRLDIFEMLLSCYDRKAQRYTGTESDRSVAEALGAGVMPGWVSAIREAEFGPAGNAETQALQAELAGLKRLAGELMAQAETLSTRVETSVAAHDRRVR